jgi:hypothetical protein
MGSDVARRLHEADWDSLIPRLLRYARANIYEPTRLLPGGRSAEDIVQEAVAKAFSGDRKWDPARKPDLEAHLRGTIDSILSSKGIFGLKEWEAVSNVEDPSEWERFASRLPNLGGVCHDAAVALAALQESIRGDQELNDVLDAVVEGFDKSGDIADVTGIPVARVYELQRKLERRRSAVLKKLETTDEP